MKPGAGKALLALTIALGAVMACGVGYLVLRARLQPERVRLDVIRHLSKRLPPDVATFEVDSAEFQLASGRLTIRGFSLTTAGAEPQQLVHADEIIVTIGGAAVVGSFHAQDVTLRGVSVSLLRDAGGSWAHTAVLACLERNPHDGGKTPTIRVQNGAILYRDAGIADGPNSVGITGVDATITSGPDVADTNDDVKPSTQLSAVARGSVVKKLSFLGEWRASTSELRIDRLIAELDLSNSSELPLPAAWRQFLNAAKLHGRAEILGSVVASAGGDLVSADIAATIVEGGLIIPDVGFDFDSVSAVLHFDGTTAKLEDFRSLTPAGSVQARGALELSVTSSAVELKEGSLSVSCPRINLTSELLDVLPDSVAEVLVRHQIRGGAALFGEVTTSSWPPKLDDITLEVRPLGLRFGFDRFPFPIELLEGKVTLRDGEIRVDPPIHGTSGTSTVITTGTVRLEETGDGIAATGGNIRLRTQDFTASELVAESFPENVRPVWDSFDPVGKIDADLSIRFRPERRKPHVVLTVLPRDLRIRYKLFPITVEHLRGAIHIDFEEKSAKFKDVEGRHHQRLITTSGTVNFATDDRSITVRVDSDAISLNDELLAALPKDVREPLIENRVSGEARVGVDVVRPHGEERVSVGVEVEIQRLVIDPKRFSFPLVLAGGVVKVNRDRISVAGLRSSQSANPNFEINGSVDLASERMDVTLGGTVNRLVFDDRLYGMFPPDVRKILRRLNLQGMHDFDFKTEFDYKTPDGVPPEFSYKVSNVRTRGGGVDVGVRFRDIAFDGTLKGQGVVGESHEIEGSVNVYSARFNRLEFGSAHVAFVYGKTHRAVLAGKNAKAMEESTFVVDKQRFGDRLTDSVSRHTLQILLDSADLYGGKAQGFFYAELSQPGEMRGDFKVEGLDLGKASRSIHSNDSIQTTGIGRGRVSFQGNTGDPLTIVGEGDIRMEGAKFVDLPTVFSTVATISKKPQADYGFTTLSAKYSIANGKFHTDPAIALEGTVLQLLGTGTMDFYGVLNLEFVPTPVGFVGPWIELVIKRLANVEVKGPIESPSAALRLLGETK